MMRIHIQSDRYTKCALSVIALCLLWIAAGKWFSLPSVSAQSTKPDDAASQPTTQPEDAWARLARRDEIRKRPGRKVIEAQEFRIVDENGRRLGGFEAIDGTASMYLYADKRAFLSASCEDGVARLKVGPVFRAFDVESGPDGAVKVSIGHTSHFVSMPNGDCEIKLGEDAQGGGLTIWHRANDASMIILRDAKDQPRLVLEVHADGKPTVSILDDEIRLRASLGVARLSAIKTGDTTTTAESTLVLFDKDGKVLWQAP